LAMQLLVMNMLDSMSVNYLQPGHRTYDALIEVYTEKGKMDEVVPNEQNEARSSVTPI
jgi:hypothetical protein